MATPSKEGKTLIEYNCKNGVYNLGGDDSTIKPLGYLSSITLDKNIQTKDIYGDGDLQLSILSDKGFTGTLEMTAKDDDLDVDLGFAMKISQGLAAIQVLQNKTIAIGFETYITTEDGVTKTKKVWLLGVNVSPASDGLNQNTEQINENSASYGITVKGTYLKATGGTTDYVDTNGNTIKVYKVTSVPSDTGYATFLDSVPVPTVKAG